MHGKHGKKESQPLEPPPGGLGGGGQGLQAPHPPTPPQSKFFGSPSSKSLGRSPLSEMEVVVGNRGSKGQGPNNSSGQEGAELLYICLEVYIPGVPRPLSPLPSCCGPHPPSQGVVLGAQSQSPFQRAPQKVLRAPRPRQVHVGERWLLEHCTVHCTHCTVLYCTVLYTVLHCTIHCTALYCTVLYTVHTVLHCTVHCTIHCTALYYTLYCSVLYTVLHCTIHCTALYYTLYCTVLYTVLHCTIHCTALYYTLYCTVLYTVLHCRVYCTVLRCTVQGVVAEFCISPTPPPFAGQMVRHLVRTKTPITGQAVRHFACTNRYSLLPRNTAAVTEPKRRATTAHVSASVGIVPTRSVFGGRSHCCLICAH